MSENVITTREYTTEVIAEIYRVSQREHVLRIRIVENRETNITTIQGLAESQKDGVSIIEQIFIVDGVPYRKADG